MKFSPPVIFSVCLMLFFNGMLLAQGVEEASNSDKALDKVPIRPVQNSSFYPDDDPDSGKDRCLVGKFRLIALNTKDPTERLKTAELWIQSEGKLYLASFPYHIYTPYLLHLL